MACAFAVTCAFSAQAAEVDLPNWEALNSEVRTKGIVNVLVHLAPVGLGEMANDLKAVKARMASKANTLVAELGQEAWAAGRDDNGIGQMSLNVTEVGLKILRSSANAVRFTVGLPLQARAVVFPEGGSIEAIERELAEKGRAHVQVVLNIEALQFDVEPNGAVKFSAPGASIDASAKLARTLLGNMKSEESVGHGAAMQQFDALVGRFAGLKRAEVNPEFKLHVTREGLEKLATSKEVRSIKPVGFVDQKAAYFEEAAIDFASKYGKAFVVISLRPPTSGLGRLSKASFEANTESNRRAIQALLAVAGNAEASSNHASVGAFTANLNLAQLQALRQAAKQDKRLLSVEINKAMATLALSTSTGAGFTNFVSAWNVGYRGAGQNIIVADSGVQANHAFLRQANNASKVTFEACFGTDGYNFVDNVQGQPVYGLWQSICPSKQANGDSPVGLVGSGAPVQHGTARCSTDIQNCSHGTLVAGIAAGRNRPPYAASFQGVANEANIVAVNIFSWRDDNSQQPTAFLTDVVAFIEEVVAGTNANTTANPYTVNLSTAGGAHSNNTVSGCGKSSSDGSAQQLSATFRQSVELLWQRGVPVVAATGNNSYRDAIGWPACVPRVIKVAALTNNIFKELYPLSNLAKQANFPGDVFWLAPGASIWSSSVGPFFDGAVWETRSAPGTSFAAPHVAGLYALFKSVNPAASVQDMNNWIQQNGSQPQSPPICVGNPCANEVFRRIVLPNFP